MQQTDEILTKQAILGDKRAFGKLVERYQNAVYGLAYHFTRNISDAHDLAQEAFLQAYLKLSQLKEPAKFAHWLRRITANICKMWLRRAKPEMLSWEALKSNQTRNGFDTPSATQPKQLRYYEPEEACEKRELQHAVQSSIDALSEKNRLSVTLYYIDGLTQKEISDFLDVPLGTIKSRLHEAKKHLQKELIQRGFGDKPSIVMVQESLQAEKLPDDFRSKVEEMLKSADSVIRRRAVHALLEHHPEDQTVEDLIIEAAKDEDSSVREKALPTLGWIRCEKAIPLLVECLKDANYQIRKRAQWSLNRIGTEPVVLEVLKLIDYPEPQARTPARAARRHAVDALKGICTKTAIPPLLHALRQDTDIGVRERIISVLADIENEDVANALVQLLWDDEPRIRRKTMGALPKMKPANIAPTLLKALDDESIEIQQRAIELIGILKYTAAEEQLIEKLDSPNPDIVFKTAEALGIMKSEKAIEQLTKLLQEAIVDAATTGNRPVGSAVAKALGNIGNPAAVPPLLAYWERLISDGTASSLGRMIAIIRALGQIGDSRAVPQLTDYLDKHSDIPFTSLPEDSRWQWIPVREIVQALARIGDPNAVPHVAQLTYGGYFIGERAVETLGHLGPAAIPALRQIVTQKNPPCPPLAKGGKGTVSHWLDKRWRAAQSLGQIGHPDALEPLSEALRDEAPVIRFRAAEALGKLNSEDAISPLRMALQDKEYNVRKAAVESLKSLGVPENELPKISKSKGKRKSKQERISPEQFRGRLPAKDSLRRALLEKFVKENFEKGIIYAEKQVDDIIHRVYEDHCSVRRYLVDYGMMSRDRGQYTVESK